MKILVPLKRVADPDNANKVKVNQGKIDTTGLDVDEADMAEILDVDRDGWLEAIPQIRAHFGQFGDHLPGELESQLAALESRLTATA